MGMGNGKREKGNWKCEVGVWLAVPCTVEPRRFGSLEGHGAASSQMNR